MKYKNTEYEVLSPTGWSNFDGLSEVTRPEYLKILFTDNSYIECSLDHIFINDNKEIHARDLKSDTLIDSYIGKKQIFHIDYIKEDIQLYDLINVEKEKLYYTNDLISHNCFIGSSNTLINTGKLRNMVYTEHIESRMDGKFVIWENPKPNNQYVLFCDVAEGVGGDYSTIQVLNVTEMPYKQVAIYKDNLIKTNVFASVINTIGNAYNTALVVVENNSIGDTVLTCLNFDMEYDNLFYDNKKFGIRMTKGTKRIGCGHLKTFIETDKLIINDLNTIEELTQFEKKPNGTFSAEKGKYDDLVSPLILFSLFMANDNFVEIWLDQENTLRKLYSKAYAEIEEDLLPIGFFPESMDKEETESNTFF